MPRVHRNSFLEPVTGGVSKGSHICILLNSEATQTDVSALVRIWDVFDAVICADGGANRLYDGLMSMGTDKCARYLPSHLIGDLDSVRGDVETFYRKEKSCRVIKDANQDVNDLEKGLQLASELIGSSIFLGGVKSEGSVEGKDGKVPSTPPAPTPSPTPSTKVVVFGAFGGRFDQQIATLHTLYKYSATFLSVVLLGDGNCATLLVPHQAKLWRHLSPSPSPSPSASPSCASSSFLPGPDPDAEAEAEPDMHSMQLIPGVEGPGCSLLPVGNRCRAVSSTGLQWDLHAQSLALGELVSTSNRVAAKAGEEGTGGVTVRTSDPLLWCCEVDMSKAGR